MTQSLRQLIAGNWKMHGTTAFASDLAGSLADKAVCRRKQRRRYASLPAVTVNRCRSGGYRRVRDRARRPGLPCSGAGRPYRGYIGDMLADAGCSYVIVGHSERRADHAEDDAVVKAKAAAAQASNLVPVICIGETLAEREAGQGCRSGHRPAARLGSRRGVCIEYRYRL